MNIDDFLKPKKVRCINRDNRSNLTEGKIYDVIGAIFGRLKIRNDNGDNIWYDMTCFELVIDSAENPPQGMELTPETKALEPKFKVGDRVYVGLTGKIARVTKIIDDDVVSVANKNNEVRVWVSNICHATPENYERLQATFTDIEFEQPPKKLTDIDLDWSIAPKWANYRTVDKDNLAKWHENKPVLGATIWSSIGLTESTGYIKGLINWQTSLRQRPQSDNADDHLHPDFAALPDHQSSNGQVIETAPVAENEEEFELQPPPIATKHYLLIENCTLSLAQDGTGQEPVLAKDIWVDDEGEELEESDCQVMRRAREPLSNWVDFRGVTYRNLLIVNNAQIFHGVFDSIKKAHDKMAELTAKKRGNFFEVIEV